MSGSSQVTLNPIDVSKRGAKRWGQSSRRCVGVRRSAAVGANNAEGPANDNIGLDHNSSHVFMTQRRLNRLDRCACSEQGSRKGVLLLSAVHHHLAPLEANILYADFSRFEQAKVVITVQVNYRV
jgi:hypothetical protein